MDALVAELEGPAAAHPVREPFHAWLVPALCAAGRRADVFDAYERVRHALADRLGLDPGPGLREAHLIALGPPGGLEPSAPLERRTVTGPVMLQHEQSPGPTAARGAHHSASSMAPEGLHRGRGNVPVPLTGLVGRQEHLARFAGLRPEEGW
ncbi:BTAD domain-containing putative transcriptional regulator [Sphaerisporangium sp. B11E5]|uniref:BTAD domain-containing putative transcriptional regulator n=1 Tax=Sphaerisporangium sp. B11E5 TaxID=3153563 RepID=UPI00325D994C